MRKGWLIGMAAALLLGGCTRELEVEEPAIEAAEEEPSLGKVTIPFTLPVNVSGTKALNEGGELNTLHLAVFGGSGYLKEYVEASLVRTSDYTYETEDAEGNTIYPTVPCYTFEATLTMSESPRTIHFLGNGPSTLAFGYDTAVLPAQLSAEGEMGYWQMIHLPEGIRAKRNAQGAYIDKNGNVIPDGGVGYIPDEHTLEQFQGIALIRNWAKIVLKAADDSHFTPISFATVNTPARGSMVPYSATNGFIEEYQTHSFSWLEQTVAYPGNLPSGTTFDSSIPDASDFQAPFGPGVAGGEAAACYLYERPAPSDRISPSFVIIYGHYRNEDDLVHEGDYFYKVDLMETFREQVGDETIWNSRYYPIYRNFKYQIIIKKILSPGFASPAAAATSAGSADVSADVSTSHLADISDGVGRLHVTPWMSKAFIREHNSENPVDELNVYFSQSTDGEPDMDPSSVKVQLLPPQDGGDDIVYNLSIDAPSQDEDDKGWRSIHFCTVAPGRTVRSQVIRITGTHESGRLYRDIIITLQPVQGMNVSCKEARIASSKGTRQVVDINIPDGLVESMFPLDFTIEAEDMTLTPDGTVAGNNLPVVSGISISETPGYVGKTTFQFIKTISWNDYLSLPRYEDDDDQMWRTISCHFRSNCDLSETRIWVANDFFYKTHDRFYNFRNKYFQNLSFTTPIPQESDVEIPLYFEMIEDADRIYPLDYPVITIIPRGLRLEIGDGITPGDDPGSYFYKPSAHANTLHFISTTSYADEFAVDLKADEYEQGHVHAYRFQMVKLLDGHPLSSGNKWANNSWSNVAWGYVNKDNNKKILLGYKDHPDKLNATVTFKAISGLTPLVKTVTPTGPRSETSDLDYHEIELSTIGGMADVEFTLSAPGYITEYVRMGRFNGNIRTMKVTSGNVLKAGNTYGFTKDNPTFVYSEDNGQCRVSFSDIAQDPNGYLYFEAGNTYAMTIESLKPDQTLFYVNMFFGVVNTEVLAPVEFPEIASGTVTRYWGANNQYVWSIPRGLHKVHLTFRAPENRDIRLDMLYIKAFNGSLYENNVQQ